MKIILQTGKSFGSSPLPCSTMSQSSSFVQKLTLIVLVVTILLFKCSLVNAQQPTAFPTLPNSGFPWNKPKPAPTVSKPAPFYMILASDTQYPRALNDKGFEDAGLNNKSKTQNANHIASMRKLKNKYGAQLSGLILNGDLTEYGHGDELEEYKDTYGNIGFPLYPGLGNHDYANNVDGCSGNGCANQMVDYLQNAVNSINNSGFDYKEIKGYSWGKVNSTYTGSLAYSWEINNVHFVQLNNYPNYTRSWKNYRGKSGKDKIYNITSSMDWLMRDLAVARNNGRVIIVNFHDPDEHWGDGGENKEALRNNFALTLKRYGVSAVFVGHFHNQIGPETFYSWGGTPAFYCGSSIYSRYLLVKFGSDSMTVNAINSANGDTIDCKLPKKKYALISNTPSPLLTVPNSPGYITFFNQGGYVAKFTLSYGIAGESKNFETGNLSVGEKANYNIPANAINIHINSQEYTGFNWKTIFDINLPAPPNKCYKTYGTTLSPNYNNNCD